MTFAPFERERVAREIQSKRAAGESVADILTWLGNIGATIGEAVDLLVENAGVDRAHAETAVSDHPEWAPLVRLAGGIHGEHL